MGSFNQAIEKLRALCHGEPSRLSWRRLCLTFDRVKDEAHSQMLLDYAAPLVEHWPEEVCRVTPAIWRIIQNRGGCGYWPLVRMVELKKVDGATLELLASLTQEHNVVTLKLSLEQDQLEVCQRLAGSALRHSLRRLLMRQCALGDEAVAALLAEPWPNLEVLDLRENQLRLESGPDLSQEALPRLEVLDLGQNSIQYAALASLMQRGAPKLRHINLYGSTPTSPEAGVTSLGGLLRQLGSASSLPSLREVAFSHYDFRSHELLLWARYHPPVARVFSPGERQLRSDVFQVFVQGDKLRNVERMSLEMFTWEPEEVRLILEALRHPDAVPRLTELTICGQLDDEGLDLLLRMPWLGQLRGLKLASLERWTMPGHQLDDQAVERLAATPALANLEVLGFAHQDIRGAGVQALIQSPHLGRLRVLDLWGNHLSRASMEHLLESELAQRLDMLFVEVCGQGEALARRWARCPAARQRDVAGDLEVSMQSTSIRELRLLDQGNWTNLHARSPWSWGGMLAWAEEVGARALSLPAELVWPDPEALEHFTLPSLESLSCWLPTEPGVWQAATEVPWIARLPEIHISDLELRGDALEVLLAWEPPEALERLALTHRDGLHSADLERVQSWARRHDLELP